MIISTLKQTLAAVVVMASPLVSGMMNAQTLQKTLHIYDKVTFYDQYLVKSLPDEAKNLNDGILRHTTSSYSRKLTADELALMGDKLTIVGQAKAIDNVAAVLGNKEKELRNPNMFSIFIGIVLGLILGCIPLSIPGMSVPIKLGIAGGPIIVGILMGAYGPRFHLTTYTTYSANLMLRQLGLTVYLAALGLSAGPGFFETVFRPEGLLWIGVSILLAIVPILIVGFVASKFCKTDYASNVGMLCGAMANPMGKLCPTLHVSINPCQTSFSVLRSMPLSSSRKTSVSISRTFPSRTETP